MTAGAVENHGVVTGLDGRYALVEVAPVASGCGRCHETGGCGGGLLMQALRPEKMNIHRVPNGIGAEVGDHVVIVAPEGSVLRAALWAYLVPALLLIVGAAIGTALGNDDRLALAGGAAGLALGLLAIRQTQALMARDGRRLPAIQFEQPLAAHGSCTRV